MGFIMRRRDDPARHPFYYAGLYYLQEPSAMMPASVLPVEPGEYVLDLCAAPGGKATELAAKLQGCGLLVANDLSASRAKALLKNIEVFGVKNSFVTNAVPARLAEQFEETFDKILVDAPCSGEGMFRKDMANARVWDMERVAVCAKTQRDITQQAVKMLRPGGMLLYSTCTFAPEENEGTVAYLLARNPDLELVQPDLICSGISEGMPELLGQMLDDREKGSGYFDRETVTALLAAGVFETSGDRTVCPELAQQIQKCIRIFPHRMDGEGHFLALFRKKGELPNIHTKYDVKSARPSKEEEDVKSARPSKEEEKVLRAFMNDVSMEWSLEQTEVRNGQAYYLPEPPKSGGRIPFLRNGLYLGEIRRGRFEPSQSLAMALRGTEYKSSIDFTYEDERVRRYLCGETVQVDDKVSSREKGWQLVCVNGYPLGWGKLVNGTLKNKYHSGWRMQQ